MAVYTHPEPSSTPYSPNKMSSTWTEACQVTARIILRQGFDIKYLKAMTSIEMDGGQGVVLVISAGSKSVRGVTHRTIGIRDGLQDMAEDGLEGKMIIYGLGFQFIKDPNRR
ncbi:hypothetical protein F4779DRAFT_593849 [Xylariaceae sp. FL0662B]|nr:hypothetical protein F4779DRAFT_593849 [Xylariaceae sp. FL0662B]